MKKTNVVLVAATIMVATAFWLSQGASAESPSSERGPAPRQSPSPTPRAISNSAPVVSPDGTRIAFNSNRTGTPDVFVINVDGTGEKAVTHTTETEGNLGWTRQGEILFSVFANDSSRLYTIGADGNSQREIAKVRGRGPMLSPDRRRLVYMAGTWTATELIVSAADGSGAKQINDGASIAWNSHWSPDNKRIAFTGRNDPRSELAVFVMNADGSGKRQLTHVPLEEGGAQWPVWSPDGRQLAIQVNSRAHPNSAHIWIVNAVTGKARKLAAHTADYLDETPSWFPDGKRIAFQSNRSGTMEVWVMKVDGSEQRQVTGVPPVTFGGDPKVSPDGSHILFISNRTGIYQIYLMATDGSQIRRLTNGRTGSFLGNWSADGRKIIYATTEPNTKVEQIVVMDRDGARRQVISESRGDQLPNWSPDGATILFASGEFPKITIHTMNRDGSHRQSLSSSPGFDYDPVFSPDGKTIAFVRAIRGEGARVYLMNRDGSNQRRVTVANESEERPTWSRDGSYLAFQSTRRGGGLRESYIHLVDLRTGEDKRLGTHDRPFHDETPSWFPNGRRIVFLSDRTGRNELWIMSVDGSGQRQLTRK